MRLISYATEEFKNAQKIQSMCAIKLGFQHVLQFSELDLAIEFKFQNAETLSMVRGAGYWIWKPTIILQYIKSIETDNQIMYLDSGTLPRKSAQEFQNLLKDNKIHVWEIGNQKIKNWTDTKVLDSLGIHERLRNSPMIWAGALCAQNSKTLEQFLKLWEALCTQPEYLHPETYPSYQKNDFVIWHRHDQSLLSIIVAENPDWFHVHLASDTKNNSNQFFDGHKKLRLRHIFLVASFPSYRALRRSLTAKFPSPIRVILKALRDKFNKKHLSDAESRSLKQNFY
jgi:hypothetical protein